MTRPAKARFDVRPTLSGAELRLLNDLTPIPFVDWAFSGHAGAAVCQRLLAQGDAIEDEALLLVEHAAVAALEPTEAALLDMPKMTILQAVVQGSGIMVRSGFEVAIRWTRAGGQNVLGVERLGAFLNEGGQWRRMPQTLFAVAEAVSAHSLAQDEAARLQTLIRLREALPAAATAGEAQGSGLLGTVTLVEAGSFSLVTSGEGEAMQLVPVLHSPRPTTSPSSEEQQCPDSLLGAAQQREFAENQFQRFPSVKPIYSLPGNTYLILSPPLRQALEVVRRACDGPQAQRRALLREPRAAIRAALGDEIDELVIERLLVETPTWSERVIGLGLWEKRVVPWIAIPGHDWFGERAAEKAGAHGVQGGLMVGDTSVRMDPESARDLLPAMRHALAKGIPAIRYEADEGSGEIPVTEAAIKALTELAATRSRRSDESQADDSPPQTLIIETNEEQLGAEEYVRRRKSIGHSVPACLSSTLKAHQREGLRWLQDGWLAGSPGVLLADDMGLGKTLQGLAFLAWLREAMALGQLDRAPVLIVAPTGLLDNWRQEHDRHLRAPGLGTPLLAYGRGLTSLRRDGSAGRGSEIDREALRSADWVLTTYETLRDQLIDFGEIRFAAILLDEAQKAKTPGIRLTDAVKAVNADFRVALTGTPVENRLADLWCIIDCAWPGLLGDLRWFSRRYEGDGGVAAMTDLKASLERPTGARPPPFLRRLKEDHLPDLPPRTDRTIHGEMTGIQLASYEAAVERGRSASHGGVLSALHDLRNASLHGELPQDADDPTLIAASVRLRLTLAILDQVAAAGDKALIFIERLEFMARVACLLQRRYDLAAPPLSINGQVSGTLRQAHVDRFQAASSKFDVMLLSPKAGGVGLTLTRATHVIHLSRWWNPAVEDQCSGRVHRIGQDRPVTVYVPLAVLPGGRTSFDENLNALLERKRRLTRDALMPPEANPAELAEVLRASVA